MLASIIEPSNSPSYQITDTPPIMTASMTNSPTTTESKPATLGEPLLLHDGESNQPEWLQQIRRDAVARFNENGLPTTRDEEWKYTSLKPLLKANLRLDNHDTPSVDTKQIEQFAIPDLDESHLVFVNGTFVADLSNFPNAPGMTCRTLQDAWQSDSDTLEQYFNKQAADHDDTFASLNLALLNDGVFVHVEKGVKVSTPIRVLNISTSQHNNQPIATQARNLIVVEEEADVTFIEDYVALDNKNDVYLSNAVTEIFVAENANANHYFLNRESEKAFNISSLKLHQAGHSNFTSHTILFGGSIVRNNVNPVLDGEHIFSTLNGIYVGRSDQHLDNHMRVEHRKPNGDSRQYYKGILADESRGVFTGRIIVSQDAQKTDAVQSNQNLILSSDAQAQTRPQLEIYADDVKCTHGATIGQLDKDALFYLKSRGIDAADAQAMLVYAFASESIERIESDALRNFILGMLLNKLPNSEALGDILGE